MSKSTRDRTAVFGCKNQNTATQCNMYPQGVSSQSTKPFTTDMGRPIIVLENGKPNHFQFLDQSPLGETTTTTAHTYYHVLLNESIHSMSNRHLLLRRSFWCPQCIRRGLPPWVAATTAAVVLLLTSLVVYACWLVQTSQHATLLSLFSTIVMWGGVRNDPSCISNVIMLFDQYTFNNPTIGPSTNGWIFAKRRHPQSDPGL